MAKRINDPCRTQRYSFLFSTMLSLAGVLTCIWLFSIMARQLYKSTPLQDAEQEWLAIFFGIAAAVAGFGRRLFSPRTLLATGWIVTWLLMIVMFLLVPTVPTRDGYLLDVLMELLYQHLELALATTASWFFVFITSILALSSEHDSINRDYSIGVAILAAFPPWAAFQQAFLFGAFMICWGFLLVVASAGVVTAGIILILASRHPQIDQSPNPGIDDEGKQATSNEIDDFARVRDFPSRFRGYLLVPWAILLLCGLAFASIASVAPAWYYYNRWSNYALPAVFAFLAGLPILLCLQKARAGGFAVLGTPIILTAGLYGVVSIAVLLKFNIFEALFYLGFLGPALCLAGIVIASKSIAGQHRFPVLVITILFWMVLVAVLGQDPIFQYWEMTGILAPKTGDPYSGNPFLEGIFVNRTGFSFPFLMLAIIACVLVACVVGYLAKRHATEKGFDALMTAISSGKDDERPTQARSSGMLYARIVKNQKKFHQAEKIMAVALILAGCIAGPALTSTLPSTTMWSGYRLLHREGAYFIAWDLGNSGIDAYTRIPKYLQWWSDTTPTVMNPVIDVTMARGEAQTAMFVVTPLLEPWDGFTTLAVDRFTMQNGTAQVADGFNVSAYLVQYGDSEKGDNLNPFIPDLALPYGPKVINSTGASLFQGQWVTTDTCNYPVAIVVKTNRNATAGTFYANVMLYYSQFNSKQYVNGNPVLFKLKITVWNFSLPTRNSAEYMIGSAIGQGCLSLMHDNFVNPYFPYGGDWGATVNWNLWNATSQAFTSNPVMYNFTALDAFLQGYFALGYRGFGITQSFGLTAYNYPAAYTKNVTEVFGWYIGNLTAHYLTKITPWNTTYASEFIYGPGDEIAPTFTTAVQGVIAFAKIVHDHSNNTIRVMMTANHPASEFTTIPDYINSLDIIVAYYSTRTPDNVAIFQGMWNATGKKGEIWTYTTQDGFPSQDVTFDVPLWFTRAQGWYMYTRSIPGYLHWTFDWPYYNDRGEGYHGYGEGSVIRQESGVAVPSLRLFAWRDGQQDMELFYLAQGELDKAHVENKTSIAEYSSLYALMSKVNQTMQATSLDRWNLDEMREFSHDATQAIELRVQVGNAIVAIASVL
ncbi:MAG TPA: hypothetical protein VKM55_22345 [Candidatus Lokiarchaeia archaeon]|nr:hypothetical protein [Candidatus Lokiarchaeia archaeon]